MDVYDKSISNMLELPRSPPSPSPEYECGKRNPLYPIQATPFVSLVMYLT
jgi:hypothetical protein